MPIATKTSPNMPKVTADDIIVGMGFQSAKVYCLNFDDLSFSIFSRIRVFSSFEMSIL